MIDRRIAPALRRAVSACGLLALAAQPSLAHPHVWITVTCDLILSAEGDLVGLSQRWRFDEMYSAFATVGLDRNRDGVFSRDELDGLSKTISEEAGEQGYFTFVDDAGGERVRLKPPTDIWSEREPGGALIFRFRADLETPLKLGPQPVRVAIYDPALFADFKFAKAGFAQILPPRAGCAVRVDAPDANASGRFESPEDALINGPLIALTNAIALTC